MSEGSTYYDRKRRIGARLLGPAVVRVPVKRIGRDSKRIYCEHCGQKRRACRCDPTQIEPSA